MRADRRALPGGAAQRRRQLARPVRVAGQDPTAGDPYGVLGITPGANSEAINKAYKARMSAASSDEEKKVIESAHTTILMSSLSARLKGGSSSVAKEIRYADRAPLFRWRPR